MQHGANIALHTLPCMHATYSYHQILIIQENNYGATVWLHCLAILLAAALKNDGEAAKYKQSIPISNCLLISKFQQKEMLKFQFKHLHPRIHKLSQYQIIIKS